MRCALFVMLPLLGLLSACVFEAPDIDAVSRHDLGIVPKGQIAAADLVVRNVGDEPLKVKYIGTSCGCTKATLEPRTIPAGGEGTLHVAYDSGIHPEDLGELKRYVFIASNDPDEDDFRIELNMNVVAP